MLIVDVSDHTQPRAIGAFPVSGDNSQIEVLGPEIYILGGSTGIQVIDGR